jgi:serine/threonine protein kinase
MARKIGKYGIQDEIGKDGFGSVYRAYDPTIGRIVAIKVLSVGDDPSVLSRFRIEAAAAGKLHHKNIVTIHDFGEHKGVPFLVMEFLEGEDLQKTIAHRRALSRIEQLQHILFRKSPKGFGALTRTGLSIGT